MGFFGFFLVQAEPLFISQRFWGKNLLHQIGEKIGVDDSSDGSTQYSEMTGFGATLADSSDGPTQSSEPSQVPATVVEDSTSGEDFFADSGNELSGGVSGKVIGSSSGKGGSYISVAESDSDGFNMDDIQPRSQAATQELPDNFKALPEAK